MTQYINNSPFTTTPTTSQQPHAPLMTPSQQPTAAASDTDPAASSPYFAFGTLHPISAHLASYDISAISSASHDNNNDSNMMSDNSTGISSSSSMPLVLPKQHILIPNCDWVGKWDVWREMLENDSNQRHDTVDSKEKQQQQQEEASQQHQKCCGTWIKRQMVASGSRVDSHQDDSQINTEEASDSTLTDEKRNPQHASVPGSLLKCNNILSCDILSNPQWYHAATFENYIFLSLTNGEFLVLTMELEQRMGEESRTTATEASEEEEEDHPIVVNVLLRERLNVKGHFVVMKGSPTMQSFSSSSDEQASFLAENIHIVMNTGRRLYDIQWIGQSPSSAPICRVSEIPMSSSAFVYSTAANGAGYTYTSYIWSIAHTTAHDSSQYLFVLYSNQRASENRIDILRKSEPTGSFEYFSSCTNMSQREFQCSSMFILPSLSQQDSTLISFLTISGSIVEVYQLHAVSGLVKKVHKDDSLSSPFAMVKSCTLGSDLGGLYILFTNSRMAYFDFDKQRIKPLPSLLRDCDRLIALDLLQEEDEPCRQLFLTCSFDSCSIIALSHENLSSSNHIGYEEHLRMPMMAPVLDLDFSSIHSTSSQTMESDFSHSSVAPFDSFYLCTATGMAKAYKGLESRVIYQSLEEYPGINNIWSLSATVLESSSKVDRFVVFSFSNSTKLLQIVGAEFEEVTSLPFDQDHATVGIMEVKSNEYVQVSSTGIRLVAVEQFLQNEQEKSSVSGRLICNQELENIIACSLSSDKYSLAFSDNSVQEYRLSPDCSHFEQVFNFSFDCDISCIEQTPSVLGENLIALGTFEQTILFFDTAKKEVVRRLNLGSSSEGSVTAESAEDLSSIPESIMFVSSSSLSDCRLFVGLRNGAFMSFKFHADISNSNFEIGRELMQAVGREPVHIVSHTSSDDDRIFLVSDSVHIVSKNDSHWKVEATDIHNVQESVPVCLQGDSSVVFSITNQEVLEIRSIESASRLLVQYNPFGSETPIAYRIKPCPSWNIHLILTQEMDSRDGTTSFHLQMIQKGALHKLPCSFPSNDKPCCLDIHDEFDEAGKMTGVRIVVGCMSGSVHVFCLLPSQSEEFESKQLLKLHCKRLTGVEKTVGVSYCALFVNQDVIAVSNEDRIYIFELVSQDQDAMNSDDNQNCDMRLLCHNMVRNFVNSMTLVRRQQDSTKDSLELGASTLIHPLLAVSDRYDSISFFEIDLSKKRLCFLQSDDAGRFHRGSAHIQALPGRESTSIVGVDRFNRIFTVSYKKPLHDGGIELAPTTMNYNLGQSCVAVRATKCSDENRIRLYASSLAGGLFTGVQLTKQEYVILSHLEQAMRVLFLSSTVAEDFNCVNYDFVYQFESLKDAQQDQIIQLMKQQDTGVQGLLAGGIQSISSMLQRVRTILSG